MSATVAILVLFGLHGIRGRTLYHHPGFTRFEAGFYELFAKFAWSVPLAWVTIACTKGYGGLINKFLSWGVFQPLAKLSYMAYLLHGSVIFWYAFTRSYELPDGYWPQVRKNLRHSSTKVLIPMASVTDFSLRWPCVDLFCLCLCRYTMARDSLWSAHQSHSRT